MSANDPKRTFFALANVAFAGTVRGNVAGSNTGLCLRISDRLNAAWPGQRQRSKIETMRQVNAPAISHADRLPSTTGGMTRLAYARAKAAGIALDPLLKQAGLTHHELEDPRSVN